MIILNSIDLESTMNIHDRSFPFPDLSDRSYISKKTVVDHGSIIAVGLVKLTAEGILITNRDAPLITRARACAMLWPELKNDIERHGLDECHAFVKNPKVQKFLKNFGFNFCKGGDPMVSHF